MASQFESLLHPFVILFSVPFSLIGVLLTLYLFEVRISIVVMIGVILLAVSWILLRLERKPLSVLGFDHPGRRTLEFGAGLLIAGAFVMAQQLLTAFAGG